MWVWFDFHWVPFSKLSLLVCMKRVSIPQQSYVMLPKILWQKKVNSMTGRLGFWGTPGHHMHTLETVRCTRSFDGRKSEQKTANYLDRWSRGFGRLGLIKKSFVPDRKTRSLCSSYNSALIVTLHRWGSIKRNLSRFCQDANQTGTWVDCSFQRVLGIHVAIFSWKLSL